MPIRRKIKNSVGYYSAAELLVREATSNDPGLPSEMLLLKIADCTKLPYYYIDTTRMIWKRLNDKSKNWRHIYKALLAVETCLIHGSHGFVKECQSQRPQFATLQDFTNISENPECSRLIREKAKRITDLLKDPILLQQERSKAKQEERTRRMSMPRRSSSASYSFDGPDYMNTLRPTRSSLYSDSDFVARSDKEEKEQIALAISNSIKECPALRAEHQSKTNSQEVPTLLNLARNPPTVENDFLLDLDDHESTNKFTAWLENRYRNTNIPISGSSSNTLTSAGSSRNTGQSQDIYKSYAAPEYGTSDTLTDLIGLDLGNTRHSINVGARDEYPFNINRVDQASSELIEHANAFNNIHQQQQQQQHYQQNSTPQESSLLDLSNEPKPGSKNFLEGFGDNLVDFDNLIKPVAIPATNTAFGSFQPKQDKPSLFQLGAGLEQQPALNMNSRFGQQPMHSSSGNMGYPTSLPLTNNQPMSYAFNQPDVIGQQQSTNPFHQPQMPQMPQMPPLMTQPTRQTMLSPQLLQPMLSPQMLQPMMMQPKPMMLQTNPEQPEFFRQLY